MTAHGFICGLFAVLLHDIGYLKEAGDNIGTGAKLPFLFNEFEESDDYREIPREDRMFKSIRELLHLTPYFWKKLVLPKLDRECHALFKFLAHPYPDGENPYLEKVESNITTIRKETKKIKDFEIYFGKRSLNFWG